MNTRLIHLNVDFYHFLKISARTPALAACLLLFSGVKILFRVGLVLLKCMLGSQEKLKACQGLYETMELLRAIHPQYMQESFLVHEVQLYSCHGCRLCYQLYCFDQALAAHLAVSLVDFALMCYDNSNRFNL